MYATMIIIETGKFWGRNCHNTCWWFEKHHFYDCCGSSAGLSLRFSSSFALFKRLKLKNGGVPCLISWSVPFLLSEKVRCLLSIWQVGATIVGARGNFCIFKFSRYLKRMCFQSIPCMCWLSTLSVVESQIECKLFHLIDIGLLKIYMIS